MTPPVIPGHIRFHQWAAEPFTKEHRAAIARLGALRGAEHIAVFPDSHPGPGIVNGVAIATRGVIHPSAVGSDIGCGYATVRLGKLDHAGESGERCEPHRPSRTVIETAFAAMQRAVRILRHEAVGQAPAFPDSLDPARLSADPLRKLASRDGRIEFATLGRGNHFVELQLDETGALWLLVHSGSRAMGQHVTRHHTQGLRPATGIAVDSAAGIAFARDMNWCIDYAAASRETLLELVARAIEPLLGGHAETPTLINLAHNSATIEPATGSEPPRVVHRKSASPARSGQIAIIPGCMGGETIHAEGRGGAAADAALQSCAHGAGRILSRGDACRRLSIRDVLSLRHTLVFDPRLAGRLIDEAPEAYRDVRAVMRAQHDLVKTLRVLRSVAVVKGV